MSNKTSEKKKEYSKSEIESILRENDWLKKEIKYLRKLPQALMGFFLLTPSAGILLTLLLVYLKKYALSR